ncbi:MAG: hypothetical protein GF364_13100 [Candidatus Lokiarchaeota archaeon]|nr:hypothetical protein [Candidatus Lokiarchaeota archaeon]
MKKRSIVFMAIGTMALIFLQLSIPIVARDIKIQNVESAEVTQALPQLNDDFELITFTGDDVEVDTPCSTDINLIEIKKDWWIEEGNATSGWAYADCQSFHIVNTTWLEGGWEVFSTAWRGVYAMSKQIDEFYWIETRTVATVTGGYQLEDYNDDYYIVNSDTDLYTFDGEPLVHDVANFSIDPYMNREYNISTNLLVSKTNLTAYLINESDWIEMDNPLFFNISELSALALGENYTHNGINYTLIQNNHLYELRGLRPLGNILIGENGVINKSVSIYIRKNGEVWGFRAHKHFEEYEWTENDRWYSVLVKSEETIEVWFNFFYHVDGGYFRQPKPWWYSALQQLLILAIPSAIIITIVTVIVKKKKKKGGTNE